MFALFLDGGPIMFLLLACSVTGVYIIIHKFLFFSSVVSVWMDTSLDVCTVSVHTRGVDLSHLT